MYPDFYDVEDAAQRLALPDAPDVANCWPLVALAFRFLLFAKQACHSHGKHRATTFEELRLAAQGFTGCQINRCTFLVALQLARFDQQVIDAKRLEAVFSTSSINFPPLNRLEEYRATWARRWQEQERQIAAERARLTPLRQASKAHWT